MNVLKTALLSFAFGRLSFHFAVFMGNDFSFQIQQKLLSVMLLLFSFPIFVVRLLFFESKITIVLTFFYPVFL